MIYLRRENNELEDARLAVSAHNSSCCVSDMLFQSWRRKARRIELMRMGSKSPFFSLRKLKELIQFVLFREDNPKRGVFALEPSYLVVLILSVWGLSWLTFAVVFRLSPLFALFLFPVCVAVCFLEVLHFLFDR